MAAVKTRAAVTRLRVRCGLRLALSCACSLAVVGFGWLPRIAAVVAWAAVGYCAVVALFGDSFELPAWFQEASPFTHTPEAPLEGVTAAPLLIIGAIVVLLLAGGLAGFRRRDLASSA
jgi:ABC-2 type transport system permease protein